MSSADPAWLSSGRGIAPQWRWSVTVDGPLVFLALARETGEVLAVDATGGLYRLDRRGRISSLTRGFHDVSALAWDDTGRFGAVVTGDSTLCVLSRQLKVEWALELQDAILALAMDPHGHYVAVSLANGQTAVYDVYKRRISQFDTVRPLSFLQFLASEATLIGAAEYGLLCAHEIKGPVIWNEKLWSNVGDLCATGDGAAIYLAGFNYGIQTFDGDGNIHGSYMVEGTPNHVATTFVPKRLVVTTLEGSIYWLDADGEMLWATDLPEEICLVCCDPLGIGIVCGFSSGRIVRLDWGPPD